MTRRLHRRGAFTLLELIVVLGIIILLMGLTISAVFRLRASQMEKNTNTHLLKIHKALEQQYSAAVDRIKKENPPAAVVVATKNADGTGDNLRAKAFHLEMRLRQEFPQKFEEVFTTPPPLVDPSGGSAYVYTPKSAFKTAIGNPLQNPANVYPDPVDGTGNTIQEAQAAALLVLILSQGQGGTATNPESIAPTKLINFPQNGQNQPPVSLRVFVDEWGTPISFRRVADDDMTDVLAELNPQFAGVMPPQPLPSSLDPRDPEGRLLNQTWPGRNALKSFLISNNPPNRPFIQEPFDGRNRGPFVFSAGGNKQFWNANGSMEVSLDNLYSYRLAQSGKGN